MKKTIIIPVILFLCLTVKAQVCEEDMRSLMETDIQFSNLSKEKGMNFSFLTYCYDDGVLLRDNQFPIIGKESIKSFLNANSDTSFILTWEPIAGSVAVSGELGYTYGTYTFINKADTSKVFNGSYVTIWKKDEKGMWKFVLDSGNQGLGD